MAAALLSRLQRAGIWVTVEADQLVVRPASRLTDDDRAAIRQRRDELARLAGDPDRRVRCTACSHWRRHAQRCMNHRAAGLQSDSVGPDLGGLLQHCPGHQPLEQRAAGSPGSRAVPEAGNCTRRPT